MKDTLRQLLRKGKLGQALDILEKSKITDDFFEQELSLISFRLNNLTSERMKGIISAEDARLEHNKIGDSTLLFIEKYKDKLNIPKIELPPVNFDPIVAELAQELASNYYRVSFGSALHSVKPETIFKTPPSNKETSLKRNILIVGAGATYASCPYMPYGKQLRAYLESERGGLYKTVTRHYDIFHPVFNVETYLAFLDRKLKPNEKQDLKTDLQKIYNRRYLPTHTYEIIAHLFKHRFIDVIINFNFDELLDEAIAEELGKSDYYNILNESDCEELDNILIDGRLKTPVYIKIYGTASSKNSMKFTDDAHAIEVPNEMQEFIEKWIRGQRSDDKTDESKRITTNIISLGFDIERSLFIDTLEGNLKEGSKFFQINWRKDPSSRLGSIKQFYQYLDDKGDMQNRHIRLEDWAKMEERDKELVPMADFWTQLWEKHIVEMFKPLYKPRSIARHKIVADIFYHAFKHRKHGDYRHLPDLKQKNETLKSYFRSSAYFFERTVVEVAIALAQNKGVIEPREAIKEDRIGYFYNLYKKQLPIDVANATFQKDNIKPYCSNLYTLNQIYKDFFKLEQRFSFSNNLLNLQRFVATEWKEEDLDFLNALPLCYQPTDKTKTGLETFFNDSEHLHFLLMYRFYKSVLSEDLFNLMKEHYVHKKVHLLKNICDNLNDIRKGFSYNITPKFRNETIYSFESVERKHVLHTNLALSYQFSNVFDTPQNWDILLLISERGKFLTTQLEGFKQPERLASKPILLIGCHEAIAELNANVSHQQDSETIKKLSNAYLHKNQLEGLNIKMHFLPYWIHHHHVAIFLKFKPQRQMNRNAHYKAHFQVDDKTIVEVVQSIYYIKQGFSNKINPLSLPVSANEVEKECIQNDQAVLMDLFIEHYMKAVYFEETSAIPVIRPDLTFEFETDNKSFTPNRAAFFKYLKRLHDRE
jgi:Effector-associated domain 11